MKQLLMALAGAMLMAAPAMAQDRGRPTTEKDVLSPRDERVDLAPENGDILVPWQQSRRIYFKHAIKSIKIEDELTVKAVPHTDHVVQFTGLAAGHTTVTMENKDGSTESWGYATVTREPHEVRIYKRNQINGITGENRQDSSSSIGGYVSLNCNEVKCDENYVPPPTQQRDQIPR